MVRPWVECEWNWMKWRKGEKVELEYKYVVKSFSFAFYFIPLFYGRSGIKEYWLFYMLELAQFSSSTIPNVDNDVSLTKFWLWSSIYNLVLKKRKKKMMAFDSTSRFVEKKIFSSPSNIYGCKYSFFFAKSL